MTNSMNTRRSLWRQPDFLRLWIGETISLLGTQVTLLAPPTIAILTFHADPFSVGVLVSLQWLSFLFVGPMAGVIVDRLPRRRIMIVAGLGRLVALGSIPPVFALGVRTMVHLYAVAAVVSLLTVFFDVAYQSYLPALVDRPALLEGNAKLTAGRRLCEYHREVHPGVRHSSLLDMPSFKCRIPSPGRINEQRGYQPRYIRLLKE